MCSCKKGKREAWKVRLPNSGLTVTKTSEEAAKAYAAKHPGSTISKA